MAKLLTNEEKMLIAEGVITIFENFLDEKGIIVRNDEKDQSENPSNLYGSDYYDLETKVLDFLAQVELISKRIKQPK